MFRVETFTLCNNFIVKLLGTITAYSQRSRVSIYKGQ